MKYVSYTEAMCNLHGSHRSRKDQLEIVSNSWYGLLMTNGPNCKIIVTKFCSMYFYLFFNAFFLSHYVACEISVPSPGIKPVLLTLEVQILNHWTTREILIYLD